MKRATIIFSFISITNFLQAQSKETMDVQILKDSAQTKDTSLKVVEKIEVEASVDRELWRTHLYNSLIPIIEKASRKGMKLGTYIVNVRFLVERDGSISQATALNDPGFGLAKASEKVILTGPKWSPGEQNGRKVRSYHTQPITFVISDK
jgi:protein TonB